MLTPDDRPIVAELAPVLRRAVTLDPDSIARLRLVGAAGAVLIRLPFDILISRTVPAPARAGSLDLAVRAVELLDWLDAAEQEAIPPAARDSEWRTGTPPPSGWRRLESVPDGVVRGLVRTGAAALSEAAVREGVPGAQPRAEVTAALLDSVVLTVRDDNDDSVQAEVTLRALSALTRMGFLPAGGVAFVDVAGRWIRVVGEYGSVYLERPGHSLLLR